MARYLLLFWGGLLAIICSLSILSQSNHKARSVHYAHKRALVNRFLFTDYCLSTEARHIRHISMPEMLSPFQDLPAYHEHFPSATFLWVVIPKKQDIK